MTRPQTRAAVLPLLAEAFREHGYEGASLSVIARRTGLGKGSLYHFFPGGKEEMAAAVLAEIEAWFEARMFRPLREDPDPAAALRAMLAETEAYFRSGRRICLVGAFALSATRDAFARRIDAYFAAWRDAVAAALTRAGVAEAPARDLAEETVTAIQGALVTASALQDPGLFGRTLARLAARLEAATAAECRGHGAAPLS
ncbi:MULTISPECIES: TetR/AcrR family transcriptional regulator [Methylobacterium]|uniref:TetR/AcrR family transcriptional regulator n=2 Tax=Methylobacterium ajmalii TaxID=2738439 RepID=A0ABU9ZU44_9HYPH|nr:MULTISPECIES: TetR/AcrR family transcriptional regulator [Methylobacterium]MBK3400021.1 TetR/AcrR family transcriptional regulator [Methylobacterium ajmalii]MBK3409389.1 TetR/AcrR family transcriptional regulator [Methylobacterium ajmalii]MBZ6416444.1 TetR/AcrR family transcriptional regulator [Methylobacterium sp.]